MVVVGLVAVDVHAQALVGCERHRELDGPLAVFARELEVGNGADHIDAHFDRLAHQLLAALEREDPLLGKGHELQGHLVADLLAQLQQGAHRPQLGVAHVDMAAHELHAVGELPAQHGAHTALDVVDAERLDALRPDGDALEKGARLVVPRLAHREHRVEVDVRLDQGRRDQRAAQVYDLSGLGLGGGDSAVQDADLPVGRLPRQPRAAEEQIQHRRNPNPCLNFDRPIRPHTQGESAWPQPRT